jgi:hypothetical protein
MHILAERFVFFFGRGDRLFLKEGVKTNLKAPILPREFPTFLVFTIYIYSLWLHQAKPLLPSQLPVGTYSFIIGN